MFCIPDALTSPHVHMLGSPCSRQASAKPGRIHLPRPLGPYSPASLDSELLPGRLFKYKPFHPEPSPSTSSVALTLGATVSLPSTPRHQGQPLTSYRLLSPESTRHPHCSFLGNHRNSTCHEFSSLRLPADQCAACLLLLGAASNQPSFQ